MRRRAELRPLSEGTSDSPIRIDDVGFRHGFGNSVAQIGGVPADFPRQAIGGVGIHCGGGGVVGARFRERHFGAQQIEVWHFRGAKLCSLVILKSFCATNRIAFCLEVRPRLNCGKIKPNDL